MSDPQLPEIENLEEVEFSLSGLEDDDLSEDAVLVTHFEISSGTSGKLSSARRTESVINPESTCPEAGETYAQMISHSRVRASVKRPVRLYKYLERPACLVVLNIAMLDTKQSRQMRRLLRFKAVDITATFEDSGGLSRFDPDIVMFCPSEYTGEPTMRTHTNSTTVDASIGISGGLPAAASVGVHRHDEMQFTEKCNVSITGSTLGETIVKWQVDEDKALGQGVPKQLTFAIALAYPIDRAFTMRLDFTANLGFYDIEFRVQKKQSVMAVRIDPGTLRTQASNDKHGPKHGQGWHCEVVDAELKPADLEKWTNLRGAEVGCTSSFEE